MVAGASEDEPAVDAVEDEALDDPAAKALAFLAGLDASSAEEMVRAANCLREERIARMAEASDAAAALTIASLKSGVDVLSGSSVSKSRHQAYALGRIALQPRADYEGSHFIPCTGLTAIAQFEADGGLPALLSQHPDIMLHAAEEFRSSCRGKSLREEKARERGLCCAVADPSAPDCPLVYLSPGFEILSGYPRSQVLGRNCRFLQPNDPEQNELVNGSERRRMHTFCTGEDLEILSLLVNERADGAPFFNLLRLQRLQLCGRPYIFAVQLEMLIHGKAANKQDVYSQSSAGKLEAIRTNIVADKSFQGITCPMLVASERLEAQLSRPDDFFGDWYCPKSKVLNSENTRRLDMMVKLFCQEKSIIHFFPELVDFFDADQDVPVGLVDVDTASFAYVSSRLAAVAGDAEGRLIGRSLCSLMPKSQVVHEMLNAGVLGRIEDFLKVVEGKAPIPFICLLCIEAMCGTLKLCLLGLRLPDRSMSGLPERLPIVAVVQPLPVDLDLLLRVRGQEVDHLMADMRDRLPSLLYPDLYLAGDSAKTFGTPVPRLKMALREWMQHLEGPIPDIKARATKVGLPRHRCFPLPMFGWEVTSRFMRSVGFKSGPGLPAAEGNEEAALWEVASNEAARQRWIAWGVSELRQGLRHVHLRSANAVTVVRPIIEAARRVQAVFFGDEILLSVRVLPERVHEDTRMLYKTLGRPVDMLVLDITGANSDDVVSAWRAGEAMLRANRALHLGILVADPHQVKLVMEVAVFASPVACFFAHLGVSQPLALQIERQCHAEGLIPVALCADGMEREVLEQPVLSKLSEACHTEPALLLSTWLADRHVCSVLPVPWSRAAEEVLHASSWKQAIAVARLFHVISAQRPLKWQMQDLKLRHSDTLTIGKFLEELASPEGKLVEPKVSSTKGITRQTEFDAQLSRLSETLKARDRVATEEELLKGKCWASPISAASTAAPTPRPDSSLSLCSTWPSRPASPECPVPTQLADIAEMSSSSRTNGTRAASARGHHDVQGRLLVNKPDYYNWLEARAGGYNPSTRMCARSGQIVAFAVSARSALDARGEPPKSSKVSSNTKARATPCKTLGAMCHAATSQTKEVVLRRRLGGLSVGAAADRTRTWNWLHGSSTMALREK